MFIQTEATPNPNSLKFILEKEILPAGKTLQFELCSEDLKDSYLAVDLLNIENVQKVFISGSFITITKSDLESWDTLKPQILHTIMDYSISGREFVKMKNGEVVTSSAVSMLSDIEKEIIELIEDRVRPAVAMDGGDITYVSFDVTEGVVYVELKGSCSGCPSSTMTLKDGIKRMLEHYIPEVKDVVAIS